MSKLRVVSEGQLMLERLAASSRERRIDPLALLEAIFFGTIAQSNPDSLRLLCPARVSIYILFTN